MSNAIPPNAPGPDRARLELVLSSARMGTWDWELREQTFTCDQQMHLLFGIAPGTFGGSHGDFLWLVHPEDRVRISGEMAAAVEKGIDFAAEFRVFWPADATTHFLETRAHLHRDPHGLPLRYIGVAWDVTDQRRMEADLERKSFLLDALMAHLPDNIYFKDTESRFTCVNQAKLKQHGLDHESQMLGKTDFDFFKPERARQALEDERRTMTSGQPMVDREERNVFPDGSVAWVSSTKLPLRNTDGRIVGTFGLSRDITKRKLAEAELARIAQELRHKNDMLEEDLRMARELQSAMLPQQYPRFHNGTSSTDSAVRFHHFFTPSMEVSGDFFAVCKVSDTQAGIFICDVMGHGVRAALVAAMMHSLIGELHSERENPAGLLAHLNRALRDTLKGSLTPMFASAFYVVVDLGAGELRYANAGHPCPLLMPGEDNTAAPVRLNGIKPGPALGLFDEACYEGGHRRLSPHDELLLFTDGLFEVEGPQGDFYDYEQLRKAIGKRRQLPADELCRGLIDEVRSFSGNEAFDDDVCLIAMEVGHLSS